MNTDSRFDPEAMAAQADRHFRVKGLTCSEACLLAGMEALGLEDSLPPEIALGLGGGVGMQGDVCGAVSGCALAISLAARPLAAEYGDRKKLVMGAVGRLHRALAAEYGSAACHDICGLDLTTPQGVQQLMGGAKEAKCVPAVQAAARLLAKELNQLHHSA